MCELAYGPAPSPRHQVAHSCGKGHEGCVNPRHLRWATPKENSADMVLHGTALRGERAINVKLTTPEVHAVKMFGEWGFRGGEITTLARVYDVAPDTIRKIFKGQNWKHIEVRPG
jgi:HNH endonuclease